MSHPPSQNRANMKNIVLEEQMELGLGSAKKIRSRRASPPRRAGWWFSQMRRVVDRAIDWKPRPPAPAHQAFLTLDRRTPTW